MKITLFLTKDEKTLPPSVIGKARPRTWKEESGYSHVALEQKELAELNGCRPRFHFEAKTEKEVEGRLASRALIMHGKWTLQKKPKPKKQQEFTMGNAPKLPVPETEET